MSVSALSVLAAASEAPDRAAIVHENGDVLTFGDVAKHVTNVMHWLRRRVPADVRAVAVVATLRVDVIIAFHALIELGIPVVPLHPRWTARERENVVQMLGVDLVLDDDWRMTAGDAEPSALEPREIDPESALAILLTSGTSGSPKGVFLSRRAFVASAAASTQNLGWTDEDRWLLSMPLAHVGGLSVVIRCLIARRAVALVPWSGDPNALAASIAHCRATIVSFVPTLLRKVLDARPDPVFPSSVRAILVGGDAAPAALLDECRARRVPALATYGMTETCAQVATQAPGEEPSVEAGVGRPLPGIELRIRSGEIEVRGPNLLSGYLPRDSFPNPFTEDGWFRTGDLGELDDRGRLHVRGRRSALIITGGENVDPLEIERVLVACSEVREACAFGVPDDHWGQVVAAAVVARDPSTFDRDQVEAAIRDLAKFKRPRMIAVVDALVTNATGKVDRNATATAARARLEPVR